MSRKAAQRGRPPNLRRREEILEVALELFGAQGYSGASMSQVARASHISTGLLFRYYRKKATLLQAILQRSEPPLKALLNDTAIAANESATCCAFLVRVAQIYAEYVRRTQNHWILWLQHKNWMPPRTRRTLGRLEQIVAEKLTALSDYHPSEPPLAITRAFLAAVFSLALLHERLGRDGPEERSFEQLLRSTATSFGAFLAPASQTPMD